MIRWACLALHRSRQLVHPSRSTESDCGTINSPSAEGGGVAGEQKQRTEEGGESKTGIELWREVLFQFHRSRVCVLHLLLLPARRERALVVPDNTFRSEQSRSREHLHGAPLRALRCLLAGCMICVFVSAWRGLPFSTANDCRELP